jgi:hypothetical protein
MKAVLIALVMTIRLSSGIRVRLQLCAKHSTGARARRPIVKGNFKLRHYQLPSLSAVDTRNGISHIPFSKKCARGARLLAISRGRDRAFFCNHSSSGVASAGLKDENGKIRDILPGAHCTIDVDGRPTIVIHVERFAQARELRAVLS